MAHNDRQFKILETYPDGDNSDSVSCIYEGDFDTVNKYEKGQKEPITAMKWHELKPRLAVAESSYIGIYNCSNF